MTNIIKKLATALNYCAELGGSEYVEELGDGDFYRPTCLLAQAGKKLRISERFTTPAAAPEHPEDAVLLDAGYIAGNQAYRYAWLVEPLTAEETVTVERAATMLDEIFSV